jgi:hypothetical protein
VVADIAGTVAAAVVADTAVVAGAAADTAEAEAADTAAETEAADTAAEGEAADTAAETEAAGIAAAVGAGRQDTPETRPQQEPLHFHTATTAARIVEELLLDNHRSHYWEELFAAKAHHPSCQRQEGLLPLPGPMLPNLLRLAEHSRHSAGRRAGAVLHN